MGSRSKDSGRFSPSEAGRTPLLRLSRNAEQSPPREDEWDPPAEFDGYQLKGCVGKGAIGRVYRAYDPALDRSLAIKFIDAVDAEWYRQERFQVEARAAARLHHPNVLAIYRIGEVDRRPYIASEFIRGDRLDEIHQPVPSERVLQIALGLARGLAAAHRGGVLHRDIKPGNVIVSHDSEVKILDFGLAKLMEDTDPTVFLAREPAPRVFPKPVALPSTPLSPKQLEQTQELGASLSAREPTQELTQYGAVVGTPGYIAPEVWEGDPATFRSDVYSAGAVLYRLCTGHPPYEGRTLEELKEAALRNEVVPVSQLCQLDSRLAAVIQRCLQRDPGLRYASGEELREALEMLAPERRDAALPEGNPYRGLRAFEAEHRALFFGREVEIRAILERLRSAAFVVIAGASGLGKSSLSRAGVIPRLCEGALDERRWSSATLTPGKKPILSFASALAPYLGMDEEMLAQVIERDNQDVYRQLRRRVKVRGPLVLFIDQLEELVTLSNEADRAIMTQMLEAFSAPCQSLRVLATVRADFLVRVASLAGMDEPVRQGMYLLKPMTAENVRQAIVGPAGAKGVTFESGPLVQQLVDSTVQNEGALPLLQFALAELWEGRDVARGVIPASALEATGGVTGALARHADGVLAGLPQEQRIAARRMLARLVTLEGTRARQTEAELGAEAPERKEALAAMVRGRLLTASESPEGPVYEVSHEALINSWPTLKRWLEEDAEKRVLHDRLATAIAEWERLGRKREALWGGRQLTEATLLEASELLPREKEFLETSRRAVQLRRRVILTGAGVVLVALVGTYFGMQYKARRDLTAHVQALVNEASSFLGQARARNEQVEQLRREAFWFFDNKQVDKGEGVWEKALQGARETGMLYEKAGRSLEAAVALGKDSATAKSLLADVLYERALLAERDGKAEMKNELLERLRLYDDGSRRAKWMAPGKVNIDVTPPGTQVHVQCYRERESQNPVLESLNLRLTTPVHDLELPQGSYLFTLTAPARTKVNLPVLIRREESRKVSFEIPRSSAVPKGYVYIPPGSFLFGSAKDEDTRKYSLSTVPVHELISRGFLVAQHETTFGEWLEYLDSRKPSGNLRQATTVGGKKGSVSLTPAGNDWLLRLQLGNREHVMHLNDTFSLPERKERQGQNWRLLPIVGVTSVEIDGFLAWLRRLRRLTQPRLCGEFEWEYAARGADGREYPHGDLLSAKEANFYETYGRKPETMGPDEVGTHPDSRSPLEIDDMSGNAWELTQSSFMDGGSVIRGGSFANGPYDIRSTNRVVVSRTFSSVATGFRVCADLAGPDP